MRIATLSLLVTLLCLAAQAQVSEWQRLKRTIRQLFPSVQQMSTEELQRRMDSSQAELLILDVRAKEEFEVSQIPGARWFSPKGLVENLEIAEGQTVVCYCSVGFRSSRLAAQLIELGHKDVYNLEGSIFEWANQGRPLRNGQGPTNKVHPYNESWGQLLLPKYHPAEFRTQPTNRE